MNAPPPYYAEGVTASLIFLFGALIFASIEILGMLGLWHFHTISYIASHNQIVRWAIFLAMLALPIWWAIHSGQEIRSVKAPGP